MAAFPLRAFVQSYDGKVPRDYEALVEELIARHIEVITKSTEEMKAAPLPLTPCDLVVGDFDWTRRALAQLGVVMPAPPDYPSCLHKFLHRKIWQSTLGDVRELLRKRRGEQQHQIFVKPAADTKAFSAIIEPRDEMIDCLLDGIPGIIKALPPTLPVHCAEVIYMASEYRVYVVNGQIRSVCPYKKRGDDMPKVPEIDMTAVEEAVKIFYLSAEPSVPAGCSMDFAVATKQLSEVAGNQEFFTCLIEVNDGYSLGVYEGLSGKDYADLLIARWHQLVGPLKKE